MLFTSLQGQYKGTLVAIVLCHTNDTTRHFSNKLFCTAHISYIGTAPLHGDAQALAIAHCYVGTPLAWSLQNGQVCRYAIHDEERLLVVTGISKALIILYDTIEVRLLHQHTGNIR